MPSPQELDPVLDLLLATTESLRNAAGVFSIDDLSAALKQRRQAAYSLLPPLQGCDLSGEQMEKLQKAIALGEEAREVLVIKRETARIELQERLAERQLSEQFRPYLPKKSIRLNISL